MSNRAWKVLKRFSFHALDFLLPAACVSCGRGLGSESTQDDRPVCVMCRMALRPVPHPQCSRCGLPLGSGRAPNCLECSNWPDILSETRAACLLRSPATELVYALKYEGWRVAGEFMGEAMARRASALVQQADLVTSMPTTRQRQRRRGYNQAEVVARVLSASLGIPFAKTLERPGRSSSQTVLKPLERRANVMGAFVLNDTARKAVNGRRIVVVDDVMTTGATAVSAAKTLAMATPKSIVVYAFARAVPLHH